MALAATLPQMNTKDPQRDELLRILAGCANKTGAFAKTFMGGIFFRPFDKPHQEIFNLLDDPTKPLKLILAPRGIGKTSIVGCAYIARQIAFQNSRFVVYISKSNTHAVTQTENLKHELSENPLLYKIFGEVKSDSFARDEWVTNTGIKVLPRGAMQQVRGLNFRGRRPDLIVIDDLEDDILVRNEEHRKALREWLYSAVMNSVDHGLNNWQIVVIGTLLHEDSLLSHLLKDATWAHLHLSLCDDAYNSLFPNFMTTKEVKARAQEFAERGAHDVFAREYRNVAIARDSASFRYEYFNYYNEADLVTRKGIETVILVDPAKTANPTSDYSAIIAVGIDTINGQLFVRDVFRQRVAPDKLYEQIAQIMTSMGSYVLGAEVTSLHEYIEQPLRNYLSQKRIPHEFVQLHARGGNKKELRIAALIPYYRQGQVYHNASGCCRDLEAELLSFPRAQYDDASDALAYIVEMLEFGGRYFLPQGGESGKELEDEMAEIETLEALPAMDSWRQY